AFISSYLAGPGPDLRPLSHRSIEPDGLRHHDPVTRGSNSVARRSPRLDPHSRGTGKRENRFEHPGRAGEVFPSVAGKKSQVERSYLEDPAIGAARDQRG